MVGTLYQRWLSSVSSLKSSLDEKSRLASKLLSLQSEVPESFKLEKPKFPIIDKNTKLEDLVTPQSFKFFTILGLKSDWLGKSPDMWKNDEDFNVANEFVNTVKVTNDIAERGIKIATDYASILTKDDNLDRCCSRG